MDTKLLRSMVPAAPLLLRPILAAVLDWMDRTDGRLAAIEQSMKPRPSIDRALCADQ